MFVGLLHSVLALFLLHALDIQQSLLIAQQQLAGNGVLSLKNCASRICASRVRTSRERALRANKNTLELGSHANKQQAFARARTCLLQQCKKRKYALRLLSLLRLLLSRPCSLLASFYPMSWALSGFSFGASFASFCLYFSRCGPLHTVGDTR